MSIDTCQVIRRSRILAVLVKTARFGRTGHPHLLRTCRDEYVDETISPLAVCLVRSAQADDGGPGFGESRDDRGVVPFVVAVARSPQSGCLEQTCGK